MTVTVVSDTFTDTSGTVLSSHTPDVGGSWVRHPSYSSATMVISNANRCRKDGSSAGACYYQNIDPGSDDYTVQLTVRIVSTAASALGPAARVSASANTMYLCRYLMDSAIWQLYKFVSGTATLLGSWSETLSSGDERVVRLVVASGSQSVVIDGVTRITATDTGITDRGYAGIRDGTAVGHSDTTGAHCDNLSVTYETSGSGWRRTSFGLWTPGRL